MGPRAGRFVESGKPKSLLRTRKANCTSQAASCHGHPFCRTFGVYPSRSGPFFFHWAPGLSPLPVMPGAGCGDSGTAHVSAHTRSGGGEAVFMQLLMEMRADGKHPPGRGSRRGHRGSPRSPRHPAALRLLSVQHPSPWQRILHPSCLHPCCIASSPGYPPTGSSALHHPPQHPQIALYGERGVWGPVGFAPMGVSGPILGRCLGTAWLWGNTETPTRVFRLADISPAFLDLSCFT